MTKHVLRQDKEMDYFVFSEDYLLLVKCWMGISEDI